MLLKKGMYNNDSVYQLQKDLVRLGYKISVDGDFGSGTEKAVKQFQRDNNLSVDGIAGKDTLGKIEELQAETSHTEFVGDDSDQPWLESALNEVGIHEVRNACLKMSLKEITLSG